MAVTPASNDPNRDKQKKQIAKDEKAKEIANKESDKKDGKK